jgi:hypothetical protein
MLQYRLVLRGHDSSVGIVTHYRLDRAEFELRLEKINYPFSAPFHVGPEAHRTSFPVGNAAHNAPLTQGKDVRVWPPSQNKGVWRWPHTPI